MTATKTDECRRIDELITALRFYADPRNWMRYTEHGSLTCRVDLDLGHLARQALDWGRIPQGPHYCGGSPDPDPAATVRHEGTASKLR